MKKSKSSRKVRAKKMGGVRAPSLARELKSAGAPEMATALGPALGSEHPLEIIFRDAVAQASSGKGEARHGHGKSFMQQTWLETARVHGNGFLTGQVEKKLRESIALPSAERRAERLGALVYLAMAVIHDDLQDGHGFPEGK